MNYIGLVQEHCQKKNIPLPVYEEYSNEGGLFRIGVKLCGETGRTDLFFGIGKNKKEAKMEAARLAFEYIELNKLEIQYTKSTYLAVDVENVGNCFKDLEAVRLSGPIKIGLYYSESWVSQLPGNLLPNLPVPFEVVKIPSSRKDASDIGMIMSLTQIALSNEYSQIVIWTKDHYGVVVKEILETGFLGCKTKIMCITSFF